MALTAEEAHARYKESGQNLTAEEVLEMGEEEFRRMLVLLLDDPETREPFITTLAEYWFRMYRVNKLHAGFTNFLIERGR